MIEFSSMHSREDAKKLIRDVIERAQQVQAGAKKNPLDELPRVEPRPLGPEGVRLKTELDQLVAAQLALTSEQRSRRQFERLMDARHTPPVLPLTHAHPFLDATIDVVQRIRINRLSAEPKSPEALGVDLILAGEEGAFSALADLKKWNIEVRIVLLEQAEEELTKALGSSDTPM